MLYAVGAQAHVERLFAHANVIDRAPQCLPHGIRPLPGARRYSKPDQQRCRLIAALLLIASKIGGLYALIADNFGWGPLDRHASKLKNGYAVC